MSPVKTVGAVVVLVAIVGLVLFLMKRPGSEAGLPANEPNADEPAAPARPEEDRSFMGSIRDLAGRTGSYRCEVSGATAQADLAYNGVVFVSNGKVRSDFTLPEGGVMVETHSIMDGETMYVWSSAMPQGMKMQIPPKSAAPETTAPQSGDIDQSYTWDCDPYTGDQSVFTPPSEISFMEFTMPTLPAGVQGMAPSVQ
jgi:hypothetical protein